MYYKAEFESHAKLVMEIDEILTNAVATIKPIIERFDGKVINKRLITALESACDTCFFNIRYQANYIYLNIASNKRHIMHTSTNAFGTHTSPIYTDHNYIEPYCVVNNENRLNAAETILNIEKYLNNFIEYSQKIKWESDHYDELKAERDQLRQMVSDYESKLTYYGDELRVKK